MAELSIVAPVFNESDTVSEFIKQVVQNALQITNDYELILVDDGSQDDSWNIIQKEAILNKKIRAFKFSRNFGHHYAITAGLFKSTGEWIVVMDSDLQDRPEVISDLYTKAKQGFEIVFVSRKDRPESYFYLAMQKSFYLILNLFSGIKFNHRQANFSIINRKVVEAFKQFPENARFYGSTIKWLGFKSTDIEARHGERFSGIPSYTIKSRLKLASDIILAFSERPLKIAIYAGLAMSINSVFIICWILWGAVNSNFEVLGWPSLIASIFLIGGVILVVLGIIGIYIGSIFSEVKKRPLYIISDEIN
jgi:dolichol-phosphate mannosyltransferase